MAKYDVEQFLNDLATTLQASLNTQIDAVTTDKADGMTLKHVDATNAYFLQTLNEKVANYDPFILYGIDKSPTDAIGPTSAKKYSITIVLTLADEGTDLKIVTRLLRYQRAMVEVLEANWDKIGDGLKLKLDELAPVAWTQQNSNANFQSIGVGIEVVLV